MKGYRRSLLWGVGPWLSLNPCRDSCLRHHGLAESLPQLGVREESFPATLVISDLKDSLKFLSPYIFLLVFTCRQLYYLLLPLHALFNLKHTIGQASRNILCESLIIGNRDQSPLILGYFFLSHFPSRRNVLKVSGLIRAPFNLWLPCCFPAQRDQEASAVCLCRCLEQNRETASEFCSKLVAFEGRTDGKQEPSQPAWYSQPVLFVYTQMLN